MSRQEDLRIPWPGPKPYDEKDWENFSGRGREIKKLLDKLNFQRLTVLVGGSGTGKTSLVRAGVIPLLRLERYHERGNRDQWPVLLLRRWGAESGNSIQEILLAQVEDAIKAIKTWGEREDHARAIEDAKALGDVWDEVKDTTASGSKVIQLLEAMTRAERLWGGEGKQGTSGGLIVVFDQFEELLRAGGVAATEALQVVRDLHRSGSPFRLMISMRQEYVYTLKELEKTIGGLSSSSVFLRPLQEKTVLEVVDEVSKTSDIPIDSEVAEKIVTWLREGDLGGSRETVTSLRQQSSEVDTDEIRRPDLLRLQAVLRELSYFAADQGDYRVTLDTLEEFGARYQQAPRKIVSGALERWIENAIELKQYWETDTTPDTKRESSDSYAEWAKLDKDALTAQTRRMAIRIGPNLSSLNYKVPQEENVLFKAAIGEDVWRLGLKDPQFRDKIEIKEGADGEAPRLNTRDLELPEELQEEDRHNLSGAAKRAGWSPAETGNQLVICFRETLHRLARANILTPTVKTQGGSEKRIWELVHDQFGPSFTSWAREHRDTWDDCMDALVVSNGIQPIAVPVSKIGPEDGRSKVELDHLSWQGCSVEPVKSERLILRDVWFSQCFLIGTIFERCDFYGGGFDKCILDGSLFRNCRFFKNKKGQAPRFERCDSSSIAIIGSRVESLEYRNCQLRQPTIDRSKLSQQILFSEGSRVVQGYFNLDPESEQAEVRFKKGTKTFLCSASEAWFDLLCVEDDEGEGSSKPLADDFWIRERH